MVRLHRLVAPLVAAGLLLSLAAPAMAADTADVRVLHASPDAPAVDVYLDDTIVDALTNVPFGTISDYLEVPAGDHNVKVYATGTTADPVIDADVTVAAGAAYTIAATGALADIAPQVLEDDVSASCSTAKVRVVHFSADAPAVDVATAGSTPEEAVVKGLEYPDATGWLELPGGTYDLEVRLAGETTVALPLPDVTIEDCSAYSVFAVGSAASPALGGNALQAVVAVDATSLPPSDTIAGETTDAVSGIAPAALALVGIGAVAFIAGLSLTARRVRQD
ncbi:MAG TPA: DUF4397 domain-containing protein [Candidatus Limnocylindrales bacterium]